MEETATDIGAEVWRGISVAIAKRGINTAHALLRRHAVDPYRGRTEAPAKSRGDATHWIDAEMRRAMADIVAEESRGEAKYVGEEESVPHNVQHGDILARTDELDGTTNALTLFGTFAIVVFIERVRRGAGSVRHVGGAIAAATGEVTSWSCDVSGNDNVFIEWPESFAWGESSDVGSPQIQSVPPYKLELNRDPDSERAAGMRPGRPGRIAVNAAHRDRRELLARAMATDLAESDDLWVSNCAGNPLIAPLLAGELSAIYEPKRLQLHDAAFLVPLYLAGGSVRTPDGGRLDVLAHFQELGTDRLIGPFIAGTTAEAVDRVSVALRREAQPT